MKGDSYKGWDNSGGVLLAYAMPLKKIWLTGKRPGKVTQVDAATAQQLILDGRGWSHKDKFGAYDKLGGDELFERLGSWSPIVRERAAIALARRGDAPVPALVKLLESPKLETRLGACQALAQLKDKAAPAVPALRKSLQAEDLWLRINAADALAAIGEPAMPALPELLEMVAKGPTKEDPRNMQQRYLTFALFNAKGGLIGDSLKGVDRELLFKAVCAGLQNEDGRARGSFISVYDNLTEEEIKPLLPAILRAVVEPAPSGIMFADGIRMAGLKVLVKHRVPEGVNACVGWIRHQNHWHSEDRTVELMKILLEYGASAKPAIPELKKIAYNLQNDKQNYLRNNFPTHAEKIRKAILDTIPALEAFQPKGFPLAALMIGYAAPTHARSSNCLMTPRPRPTRKPVSHESRVGFPVWSGVDLPAALTKMVGPDRPIWSGVPHDTCAGYAARHSVRELKPRAMYVS